MESETKKHAGGRPPEYGEEILKKAYEYLNECIDTREPILNEKNEIVGSRNVVKVPTKGGLAVFLNVSRDTLYDWAGKYQEFSDIMERMGALQEERLINKGLGGEYNSTISKVLLTKHGYREGLDATSNDEKISEINIHVIRGGNGGTNEARD